MRWHFYEYILYLSFPAGANTVLFPFLKRHPASQIACLVCRCYKAFLPRFTSQTLQALVAVPNLRLGELAFLADIQYVIRIPPTRRASVARLCFRRGACRGCTVPSGGRSPRCAVAAAAAAHVPVISAVSRHCPDHTTLSCTGLRDDRHRRTSLILHRVLKSFARSSGLPKTVYFPLRSLCWGILSQDRRTDRANH